MPKNIPTARSTALEWLIQVTEGRSVNEILSIRQEQLNPQDVSLAKNMLFGVLRHYHHLKTITDNLLEKPLKKKDSDILLSIVLGLYQLKYLSIPDHAAISESVELAKSRKKWAAGLVNGTLRRFQRESSEIEAGLEKSVQFKFSHQGWMVKQLKADWPEEVENVLTENNLKAPMIIRVNTVKTSSEKYLEILQETDPNASAHDLATDGIVLANPLDVCQLPGFGLGEVTVQDAAPQLAVELLDLKNANNILDGCAAPGGKTGHILQRNQQAKVTAVELSQTRAERIRETLDRLGLNCEIKVASFLDIDAWWNGQKFDRILLDVPCSASGVIRRNPDIKIHRKVTDLKALTEIQAAMLEKSWDLLEENGILVYATCSIFKQENEVQISRFLENLTESDSGYQLVEMPERIKQKLKQRAKLGYQILPGEFDMDGFYLCGIRKVSKN